MSPINMQDKLEQIVHSAKNRFDIWSQIITTYDSKIIAEIGIFRGNFASAMLDKCPTIETYYMVDPWKNQGSTWNVPANVDDINFAAIRKEALTKTEFASEKRVVIEATSVEAANKIPDSSLDMVYIDGDHTLRGITIDLMTWLPKVKPGGFLCGDDFGKSIFPQPLRYEPAPIFPFAVYFAEAIQCPIYAMPGQFLIHLTYEGFQLFDLSPNKQYQDTSMRSQIVRGPLWYFKKQYLSPIYQRLRRYLLPRK